MAAISTLRAGIASALTDNTKYSVFSFPPATPIANSVIVAPADPYISPSNGWHASISPMANFVISVMVPLLDNEGNLNGMEDNIVRVFNLLAASPTPTTSQKYRLQPYLMPLQVIYLHAISISQS
jgi:hypothetical protein